MLLQFVAHGSLTALIFDILIIYILLPIYGVFILLLMGRESVDKKIKKIASIIFYPAIAIILLIQVYILLGWAAYMSTRSYIYTQLPQVENEWLYYLLGLVFCAVPLVHISLEESKNSFATYILSLITIIMYVIFSIWPNLVTDPYNWVLRPLIQLLWN